MTPTNNLKEEEWETCPCDCHVGSERGVRRICGHCFTPSPKESWEERFDDKFDMADSVWNERAKSFISQLLEEQRKEYVRRVEELKTQKYYINDSNDDWYDADVVKKDDIFNLLNN